MMRTPSLLIWMVSLLPAPTLAGSWWSGRPDPRAGVADWDEGHDFLFFGEEAWLEPPGEFEFINRLYVAEPERARPLDRRVPGGRADVSRLQVDAGIEVETGLAPRWELELELAGRWLRDRDARLGEAGDHLALTEIEAGVRYSPWWTSTGVWTVGIMALAPTGSAAAGVTPGDGAAGVLHTSLTLEPGRFSIHAGLFAELRLPRSRPRDVQGEEALDVDGRPFEEALWSEVELYGALGFSALGRQLWLQLEYLGELEPEVEARTVASELEHRVGLGVEWLMLVQEEDEIEPMKFGLMPYLEIEGGEIEPGVQLQFQFEVE